STKTTLFFGQTPSLPPPFNLPVLASKHPPKSSALSSVHRRSSRVVCSSDRPCKAATASIVVPASHVVAQPPPFVAPASSSVLQAATAREVVVSFSDCPCSSHRRPLLKLHVAAAPSHPSQHPLLKLSGRKWNISSSGNNCDVALPNDSASVRSPEALPVAPAPRLPLPQRNTKKVAVRGRAKMRDVEELSEDDTPETATNAAEPSDGFKGEIQQVKKKKRRKKGRKCVEKEA
ncbi:hypothetical protein PIB30_091229, partial [Stylosanthes scabra]|nr:hypothetical protein [Stylosanthes scabra]